MEVGYDIFIKGILPKIVIKMMLSFVSGII